jgi:hypothetical protein
MKKFICLLGIFLMLTLLVPPQKAEARHGVGWILPGLLIGGAIGLSLAPRYYYPPAYYYPPPVYYYPAPNYVYPPPAYSSPPPVYSSPPPAYSAPPPTYSSPPSAQAGPAPQAEPQITGGQIFIYPRQGQNDKQLLTDRNECHNWALDKTGYDPTKRPPADMPPPEIAKHSTDYHRALGACLDGRGYSMR